MIDALWIRDEVIPNLPAPLRSAWIEPKDLSPGKVEDFIKTGLLQKQLAAVPGIGTVWSIDLAMALINACENNITPTELVISRPDKLVEYLEGYANMYLDQNQRQPSMQAIRSLRSWWISH
jgi:hypothetical protein